MHTKNTNTATFLLDSHKYQPELSHFPSASNKTLQVS